MLGPCMVTVAMPMPAHHPSWSRSCLPVLALQPSHPHGHAWLFQGCRRPWSPFLAQICAPPLAAVGWGCGGEALAPSCPIAQTLPALTPQTALAAVWRTHLVLWPCIICTDIVFPQFPDRCTHLKTCTPWSLGAYHARALNKSVLWSFLTAGQRKFLCRRGCSKGTKEQLGYEISPRRLWKHWKRNSEGSSYNVNAGTDAPVGKTCFNSRLCEWQFNCWVSVFVLHPLQRRK